MIKPLFFLACIVFLVSCSENTAYKKAEDAQDAGREFIRATLDGNYEKAKFYLLKNEDNLYMLDKWKQLYDKYSSDSVREFKNADIRPIKIESLNDSTTLYRYSNSFTKDTTALKIVRVNNEWLVDLKTFISE